MATGRLPDPNTAPVTAKGDLYTYSTVPAKLAVGSNGETLVADSSASTGLRWQGNYAAGKNAIINGDFRIWQRGTTFNGIGTNTYTADRWTGTIGNTVNVSQQTFTAGTAPVAGYEGQFFIRYARTTSTNADWFGVQKIEDVRTFAGQTVTLSFWAKVGSGTVTASNVYINQNFGSGGSATVDASGFTPTFTTSWARYSYTVTLPSISGKTIGAGSFISTQFQFNSGLGNITFDLWGVQLEAGNTATAFQTATGTLAGELAACQRYYYRNYPNTNSVLMVPMGFCTLTTQALMRGQFPVTMRTKPTALEQSGTASDYALRIADTSVSLSAVPAFSGATTENLYSVTCTVSSGLTAGQGVSMQTGASTGTAAYLGWSAEL